MRSQRKNTLDFAAWVYSDRPLLRRMDSVQAVKHDMVLYFKHYLHFHHTSAERRQINIDLGSGKSRHIVSDTIHEFSEQHFLRDCGFEAYVGRVREPRERR